MQHMISKKHNGTAEAYAINGINMEKMGSNGIKNGLWLLPHIIGSIRLNICS